MTRGHAVPQPHLTTSRISRGLAMMVTSAVITISPVEAQDRVFTSDIALDVRTARIAAVTEDGARVAVTVQTRRDRTDVDHQRYGDPTYVSPVSTRLMVIDTRSGEQTWVHEQPTSLRGYTWSPDGEHLAYFAHGEDGYSLRVFDASARRGSAIDLRTELDIASSSPLVWSPDGRSVLVSLRPAGWGAEAREAFLDLTVAPVIVQDSRNDFLAWDRVRNLANRQITVLVSLADGGVEEILSDLTPSAPRFSADGSTLLYATAARTKTSYTRRDGTEYAIHALDLESGESSALMGPTEERLSYAWSEAGDAFAYAEEGAVFVQSIGSDEPVDVTDGHREVEGDSTELRFSLDGWSPDGSSLLLTSRLGWHLADTAGDGIHLVLELDEDAEARPRRSVQSWSEDGRWLYFSYSARDQWQRGLKRLDLRSGQLETLILDDHMYRSWNVSKNGEHIVYAMSDGDRPDEIYVADNSGKSTTLTTMNPQLDDVALTRSELIEYLDVDGNRLYGILYYPSNYQPGETYPLVAEIYEQYFDNGYNENMNLITAQGWFGFRPSVRFEEGYPGEAWLKAVPNAINEIIDRGLVDPDQLGVYGQSYGGYATNLLITQTDRFAAAANVSGKVNIISFLGDSPKITTRNYAAAEVGQDRIGATLWEQPHKYINTSAVMFADRIETPLLMLSGEGDWNVPATNQREMYYALRRLGKDVVWVHYTAGGHGAGRASTEEDFVDHWRRMVDWFAEHFDEVEESAASDRERS
ncbi:MAG: prolyl oligopeptidase family serine peptidase [Gemmatimonadota bacterium]|nr:prolyl oligopeptidase family serine peptidase [Gemmatimonadota bacterium]MDE3007113.1 prolyl oligopeptidase family serine peptidase [Gemmatimonadota bacterium]MDE3013673.1 prolyl oligopeptidase family serine peptidase [Gemmatimonadota bacterium]